MIIDYTSIYVRAGHGGEGSSSSMSLSARRMIGGGGDGGCGGDVIIQVSPHLYDLSKFSRPRTFVAGDGQMGREHNKKGRDGESLTIDVPRGTRVYDRSGELLVDLLGQDASFVVCRGGAGGKGNYKRTYSLPAQEGQERTITLDYRIPVDVVLVGFANSGKTTLCNALTGQSFKVAEYPFTTTSCMLAQAVVDFKPFTVLDTPPIKGKTDNRFLRQLERCKVVLLLSDNKETARKEYTQLRAEIMRCGKDLLTGKKVFHLLTKLDTIDTNPPEDTFGLCAQRKDEVDKLVSMIRECL